MNELSIIILNYNTPRLIVGCLKSIISQRWRTKFEIVVVDNASTDDSVKVIKDRFPEIKLVQNETNSGFSAGSNLGLKHTQARYHLFLNSDTEVKKGCIDQLLNFIKLGDFGILSCKLINSDGSFQPNGGDLPTFSAIFNWLSNLDNLFTRFGIDLPSLHQTSLTYYQNNKIGWVGGTAFLVKDEVIKKGGAWDENIFMYGEDIEWCLRATDMGFSVGWTDKAEIIHLGGGSSDRPQLRQWLGEFKGLIYLYKKHFGVVATLWLKVLIYLFVILRVIAFLLLGRLKYSFTYAKIIISI